MKNISPATPPDFNINSSEQISSEFVSRHILTFEQAAFFVSQLPYGRNSNKNDITAVFSDGCGTCSTKHALLKRLADENNFQNIQLFVGLFKMNKKNMPQVAGTLQLYNLDYIPEAHCYLKYKDLILDYTKKDSKPADFVDELIEEIEISPEQITDYKINYHKDYLTKWINETKNLHLTLEALWSIREQCIQELSSAEI